jgi:hypothetical protein
MAGVKYHYALDEHNRLVSIKQAYLERDKGHTYHCIGCGAGMIARLGEVRNWHFAHRRDEPHCGNETYLHKLAKRLIKEIFDNDSSFLVGYYRDVECSDSNTCPFVNEQECHLLKLYTFDLKKYYDTCQEEQSINDYVADLLLTNSEKPDRDPVLIEVQVSHKSTHKKLSSGLRIIEIRIESEEDVDSLLSAPIVENPDAKYGLVRDVETIGFAKFHGFNKKSSSPEPLSMRNIPRFHLFRSGKAFVTNMEEVSSCRNVWNKDNEKAIFEVSIDCCYVGSLTPYEYGYVAAQQHGINVKTCQLCKYHLNGFEVGLGLDPIFCCLHKKYGTPENPEPQYANNCSYYRKDKELLDEIQSTMPPIVVASPSNTGKL